MTTLTPEILNAVMAKQGAPNTTDNLNRIAEFAALHPGVLEKYIGGGTDAGMTGNSIDNSIAATDGVAPRGPVDPNGYVSTVDPNTGMSNVGPRLTNAPNIADPSRGGGGARKPAGIPGDFNAPVGAPPFAKPAAGTPDPLGTGDSLGVPWWLAPFAARALVKPKPNLPPPFVQEPRGGLPAHLQQPDSGAPGRTRAGGVTDVNDLNARSIPQQPQGALPAPAPIDPRGDPRATRTPIQGQPPQITGSDVPTYPGGAPQITPNDINAATRGEVQKQVDAENERLLKEEMAKQNAKPRPARPARPGIR
jgi:hypothetical protein